jgi:hypothetical protein
VNEAFSNTCAQRVVKPEKNSLAHVTASRTFPAPMLGHFLQTVDNPLPPRFITPFQGEDLFPLRLLTCKTQRSMHSQSFLFEDREPAVSCEGEVTARLILDGGCVLRYVLHPVIHLK